jgi:hypothetical protein
MADEIPDFDNGTGAAGLVSLLMKAATEEVRLS